MTLTLTIEGMTCASCVARAEKALARVPGVDSAVVNLATERAEVTGAATAPVLIAALETVGFGSHVAGVDEVAELVPWRPVWLAGPPALILAAPMLLLAFGVHMMLPPYVALAFAVFVQLVPGSAFYRSAWTALRAGAADMDTLVVLGTTTAFALSCWNMFGPVPGPLYFESSAVIIALVLFGRALESRARAQTASAIRGLAALRPTTALVRRDGLEVSLPVARVAVGDMLVILPGARIPADAELVDGIGSVDESHMTGESMPVHKVPGAALTAGALNGSARLVARATRVGGETTLARMVRLVEAAQSAKPPIQRLVDRVSAIFVPSVIAAALLTLVIWLAIGATPQAAVLAAASVLVIACPCALGLATPTAIMAGTGAAARAGILIRDPAVLEVAGRISQVVFDKTGTLTVGKPTVAKVIAREGTPSELLHLAASLQVGSEHALARAVLSEACAAPADEIIAIPGQGVSGMVGPRELILGNAKLMQAHEIDVAPLASDAAELAGQGATVSYLAEAAPDARLIGLISFADALKPEAHDAIARLRARGLVCTMLSGDNTAAVALIAAKLGLDDARGEVAPDQKAAAVAALRKTGPVAMVGDGINDAPALAEADLGIAMATGTDVAIDAAGITLMRGDVGLVADALDIAAHTQRKIKQGLGWAFCYNVVGIPLAALGWLTPTLAGAAMALSSLSVVGNAVLLGRWRAASSRDEAEAGRPGRANRV